MGTEWGQNRRSDYAILISDFKKWGQTRQTDDQTFYQILIFKVGTKMGTTFKSTDYKGIRYREHPTRKHGVKKDIYFVIRFQRDGVRKEEALGWASEGWTLDKAIEELSALKKSARTGEGESSLRDKRQKAKEKKTLEKKKSHREKLAALSFSDFFKDTYFPHCQNTKSSRSYNTEDSMHRLWIEPVIGSLPLVKVSPIHLERIKKNMADAGKSPRTIQYCLAIIRQVFNHAYRIDMFSGDNPVKKVKSPSFDNRKVRFITHEEADKLLDALRFRSEQLHDMALLSLHCGLRAGEIFSLTWADVDLVRGILNILDTKTGANRSVFLTREAKKLFTSKRPGSPSKLVFPDKFGKRIVSISNTFDRTVKELGFNKGITDRRQKMTFHTLRHTHASWLVMEGIDLYTVQRILGHSTIKMTERYSHLAPEKFKAATEVFERGLAKGKKIGKMR